MELTLFNSIDVITNILDRGIYKSLFCMGRWMRIDHISKSPPPLSCLGEINQAQNDYQRNEKLQ